MTRRLFPEIDQSVNRPQLAHFRTRPAARISFARIGDACDFSLIETQYQRFKCFGPEIFYPKVLRLDRD